MKKNYVFPQIEILSLENIETTDETTPSVNVDFNEWE